MKVNEIRAFDMYAKAEEEIRAWVEESYPGLSLVFEPHLELVRIREDARYTKPRVRKIVEAVNGKIGEILEQYAQDIYTAEMAERACRLHPAWNDEFRDLAALRKDKRFLQFIKEMNIHV